MAPVMTAAIMVSREQIDSLYSIFILDLVVRSPVVRARKAPHRPNLWPSHCRQLQSREAGGSAHHAQSHDHERRSSGAGSSTVLPSLTQWVAYSSNRCSERRQSHRSQDIQMPHPDQAASTLDQPRGYGWTASGTASVLRATYGLGGPSRSLVRMMDPHARWELPLLAGHLCV